jgi:hypothetical protein
MSKRKTVKRKTTPPPKSALSTDTDAMEWAKVSSQAGSKVSPVRLSQISVLIRELKANNVWNSLDRLWIFAAATPTQALIDLATRTHATPINSPSFAVDRGYTGDGSSSYLDSGLNASKSTNKFVQDNAAFGVWILSPSTKGGPEILSDYGAYSMLITNYAGTHRFQINSATDLLPRISHDGHLTGFFHGQRTESQLTSLYGNDAVLKGRSTDRSIPVVAKNFLMLGDSVNFSNAQIGAAWIGKSLRSVESLYKPLRKYMSAIGVR